MADRAELLAEAYRRGILNPEQRAAFEEAQRRGLVGGGSASTSAPRRPAVNGVTGFMANVNRAIPLADEAAAGIQAGVNMLSGRASAAHPIQAFNNALATQRGYEDAYDAEHPRMAALGRGLGMAGTVALPGGQTAAAPNALSAVVRGTGTAAGTGAAYAIADRGTPVERLKAGAEAAVNPLNLVLGAVGGRMSVAPKGRPGKAPTLPELTKARKAAYEDVKNSGHKYTPEAFAGLVDDIKTRLSKEQFDGDFQPRVQLMLDRLDAKVKQGYAPTLGEMDELRKFVTKNVRGDGNTVRLGGVIRQGIDNFIDTQGGAAAGLVGEARGLFKRESKVKEVTKAVNKAERQAARSGSGGNANNSIRAKLDTILEKNPYLSNEERAAIDEIVMGTKTQNTLRQVGKLSPEGNGLMLAGHLAALPLSHGLSGIAAIGGAGAKASADNMTRQKVTELIDLMAAGGTREQLLAARQTAQKIEGPAGAALRKLLAAKLARIGGVAAAAPSASPAR